MSSRSQPEFLELPPELMENVTKQVTARRDLSSMRLACKMLNKPATKELFKSIYVSPEDDDISNWNSLSENDEIRLIPRQAIIYTHSEEEDEEEQDSDDEGEKSGPGFKKALAALSKFPNLDSLHITFSEECKGRDIEYWEEEPAECIVQREHTLKLIFQAIQRRAAEKESRTIRSLTIENLQNCPIPEFTSSDLFRDVMGRLDELHISLTQEHNEHGPDHDYTKIELQTFPAHFCAEWLKPIAGNLKALSLYHRNENWGPFPGTSIQTPPDPLLKSQLSREHLY